MFDFGKLARTICSYSLFGEWITYGKASGATRRIRGAVKRVPARTLPENGRVLRPYMELTVEDHMTTGISVDELETSTDWVKIPLRMGCAASTLSISRILRHARTGTCCGGGILVLEIR